MMNFLFEFLAAAFRRLVELWSATDSADEIFGGGDE